MALLPIVKALWSFSAVSLIVLVLLHSPKGEGGLGGLSGQAQLFTSTKSAEKTLNQVTWLLVTMFLTLSTLLSMPGVIK
jgi:preprotein translocase subunit SecG